MPWWKPRCGGPKPSGEDGGCCAQIVAAASRSMIRSFAILLVLLTVSVFSQLYQVRFG